VQTQLWSRPEYLFTVSPHVFHPKPKVDSAVVRFHFDVAAPEADPKALKSLIRMAFGQRRKTLSNTLKPLLSERITDAGQRAAFAEEHRLHRRAEELVPTEFVDLCRAIYEAG
jgi:16S rRNA (adenine1518-N6/adenine1519-N6)-dimethyltransferase